MIDNYNQNPNQLQPNVINPNAMGNMQTLQGVNGMTMPNTFNRTIGTAAPGINPLSTTQNMQTPYAPSAIPQGVQTDIMPNNNLQTY
jgi:hypothetical protein